MLSSCPDVLDLLYTEGWYKHAWIDGCEPRLHKRTIVWKIENAIIDTAPEYEIRKLLSSMFIHEGITFIHEYEHFYECYDFAGSDCGIYNVDNKLLQRFCFYFREQASSMLQDLSCCAFVVPDVMLEKNGQQDKVEEFMRETNISRYYFDSDFSYLTAREAECVYLNLCGLSSKGIGKKLELSHRTIEVHLDRARKKFDFATHSALFLGSGSSFQV